MKSRKRYSEYNRDQSESSNPREDKEGGVLKSGTGILWREKKQRRLVSYDERKSVDV